MSKTIKKSFYGLAIIKTKSEVIKMQDYMSTVEKAKAFINENIETATPESVSSYCGYSQRQLSRIFKMVTGATLGEFLRWSRLSKALYELKHSDKSILDVALDFKYESQEAFTRIFKSIFGINPGECKKSDKNIGINGRKILQEVSHESENKLLFRPLFQSV